MSAYDLPALQRQLAKYETAIAEFAAIESELQHQSVTPRVADLLRINRETIRAMERSIELVRERIAAADASLTAQATSAKREAAGADPL
jgi:hypothetical protein